MKIHIVQKGDTLWEIAKNYGVDFEELKQINSHLSSPDLIMPGMKIKIPSTSKPVKKETKVPPHKESVKEKPKEKPKVTHPYKPITPKPTEVSKKKPVEEKKEQPIFQVPKMPILDYGLPEMPQETAVKPPKEKKKKEVQKPIDKPKTPPSEDISPEAVMPEYMPPPMMPIYPVCHYVHPCCYHIFHPHMSIHGAGYGGMMQPPPYQGVQHANMTDWPQMPWPAPSGDCGCHGQGFQHPMAYGMHDGRDVPEQQALSDTQPYPHELHSPNVMNHQLYPNPPIGEGPPSFSDLRMNDHEDEQNSEE